ncbi:PIN domain-containing protein [Syntrophomonas wolfei]|jgi:predicted nucleic acid-binding protein|uniref:PIN domain-containing protein n=1 Tax=Syntrophomonas wolfei TaxID=863 RepID=UPI0007734455|nr:PIN domain-containing protein [Syntrophomonas wolfei]
MSEIKGRQFIDTNILVYAYDCSAGNKYEKARNLLINLWEEKNGCLSIQVLQEFYVIVTRKLKNPISAQQAANVIENYDQWPLHSPNVEDLLEAINIQKQEHISFWDSLIIRSAQRLGCTCIWTEDLNNGQKYGGILVKSPFS